MPLVGGFFPPPDNQSDVIKDELARKVCEVYQASTLLLLPSGGWNLLYTITQPQLMFSFRAIAPLLSVALSGLLFACVQLAAQPTSLPPEIHGRIVAVHDGDSVTLLTAQKTEVKVRLDGIDAPELKQPFGAAAKQALSSLIFGKDVTVKITGKDRYGRSLGLVWFGTADVNRSMVAAGMAWHYEKYSKDRTLAQAQAEAKTARRGLWADPSPVPPWAWRKPAKAK